MLKSIQQTHLPKYCLFYSTFPKLKRNHRNQAHVVQQDRAGNYHIYCSEYFASI